MKLILGANKRQEPGWTHHDVLDLPGIDICCEFFDLPKHVEKGSCEEIQMTHMLEHFPAAKTQEVLRIVRDMLCDGGKLYIEVPNFQWHGQEIMLDPTNRQIVEYAYGGQIDEWDFHYNGFTPQILEEDLQIAGFRDIKIDPYSSLMCWAVK